MWKQPKKRKKEEQRHKRLSRIHLLGDEIYCDNIWILLIKSRGSRHQALHHTTLTTKRNSRSLHVCPLSFTLLSLPSLVFSFYPSHSHLSIPSCFYCHPSLFEGNHALSFFIKTDARLPSAHHFPPPLFPVLSLHLRHDCEAAAITMSFEVSYNIPNRELSCQFSHITAQGSHLYLVGPPASTLWRWVHAKLTRLEWEDHQVCSSVVWKYFDLRTGSTTDLLGLISF